MYQFDPQVGRDHQPWPGRVVSNPRDTRARITYYISPTTGLSAFSIGHACFYRISIDPAHPLSNRGSIAVPTGTRRPEGVEEDRGDTYFTSGKGSLVFNNATGIVARLQPVDPATLDTARIFQEYAYRILNNPGEQARISAAPGQIQKLKAVIVGVQPVDVPPQTPEYDVPKLDSDFADYRRAKTDDDRDKAARPILDAARRIGDVYEANYQKRIDAIKGTLTPDQLKLLGYSPAGGEKK